MAEERHADGSFTLAFCGDEPVEALLERAGTVPLPPYISGKRATDAQDREDYQTLFAREDGAVAAPTAALHFTPGLSAALDEAGIGRETLTLHVGAGTFLPVKVTDTEAHRMHSEWGRIDPATADRPNAARASGGRLVAVGTTSLRLLESAADPDGAIRPFEGDTAIFITFDEGGGYYDSGYVQPLDYFGDGTRVPLLVVSQHVKPGHISHRYADHVSILKFIERN